MADVQIHELAAITRLPSTNDVLAIDTGSVTWKVSMTNLVGSFLKTSSVTATTDSNGNINLDLAFSTNYVVAARSNGYIVTPWTSGSDQKWHARVTGITGTAVANTSVTVNFLYYVNI